jgi:hypothetical protein
MWRGVTLAPPFPRLLRYSGREIRRRRPPCCRFPGLSFDILNGKRHERTRNEFRVKVARDNGFWVQGTLRPW